MSPSPLPESITAQSADTTYLLKLNTLKQSTGSDNSGRLGIFRHEVTKKCSHLVRINILLFVYSPPPATRFIVKVPNPSRRTVLLFNNSLRIAVIKFRTTLCTSPGTMTTSPQSSLPVTGWTPFYLSSPDSNATSCHRS